MIPKPHNPRINDPVRIFGINFYDLAITVGVMLLLIILLAGVNILADFFPPIAFLVVFLIFIVVVFIMKFANKQNHPQFLLAYISYFLFQPKKILFRNPNPGKKTL
jgi:hypothetical protein